MKKTLISFLLITWLMAGVSFARTPNFYFTLGIGKPMAPPEMKNNYLSGANVGIMAGLPVTKRLELIADVAFQIGVFNSHGFRDNLSEEINEAAIITGNNASFLTTMIKTKFILSPEIESKHIAYLFAGPGLFLSQVGSIKWIAGIDSDGNIPAKTQTVPGVTCGLGVELNLESTTFIFELGAIMGFTENKTTVIIPIRIGLALKP
ncbi:hypothetical protein ACFL4L_01455 [bacterium]